MPRLGLFVAVMCVDGSKRSEQGKLFRARMGISYIIHALYPVGGVPQRDVKSEAGVVHGGAPGLSVG